MDVGPIDDGVGSAPRTHGLVKFKWDPKPQSLSQVHI